MTVNIQGDLRGGPIFQGQKGVPRNYENPYEKSFFVRVLSSALVDRLPLTTKFLQQLARAGQNESDTRATR